MTKQQLFKQLLLTKKAGSALALSSIEKRNKALRRIARVLYQNQGKILKANQKDVQKIDKGNPMRDRLLLTKERLGSMITDIETVIKLPDPLNQILEERILDNGLRLKKISVPFGVIGIVYESRPNVTVDVVSLCLKSGNAVVLKGGEEAEHSNLVLVKLIHQALQETGIEKNVVLQISPYQRKLIKYILEAEDYIDLFIPRGGAGLINFVRETAKVPVIETGAGVCHTYVDRSAKIQMAADIVFNAKTSRPSTCNALDTLLVHQQIASKALPAIARELKKKQVEVFADKPSFKILRQAKYPYLKKARSLDFGREFLSLKIAIKTVANIWQAIEHINKYSTGHSESIITESQSNARQFLRQIDAACVYHNASTRFTDGSQFGMGGEIGISTQKLHARGPMSIKEITTYKWIIYGNGQTRR